MPLLTVLIPAERSGSEEAEQLSCSIRSLKVREFRAFKARAVESGAVDELDLLAEMAESFLMSAVSVQVGDLPAVDCQVDDLDTIQLNAVADAYQSWISPKASHATAS